MYIDNEPDNPDPIWIHTTDSFHEWKGEIYDDVRLIDMYETAPKNVIILVNDMCFVEVVENDHEEFLKINVNLVRTANESIYATDEKVLRDIMNNYLVNHHHPRFHYYEVYDVEKRKDNKLDIILQFEIQKEYIGGFTWDIYMDDIEYLGMEFMYASNLSLHADDFQDTIIEIADNVLLNDLGGKIAHNKDIPVTQRPGMSIYVDSDMMKIQQTQTYHIAQEYQINQMDKVERFVINHSKTTMDDIERYVDKEVYRDGMLYKLEDISIDLTQSHVGYTLTLYIPTRKLRIISWKEAIYPFEKFYNEVIYKTFGEDDISIEIDYNEVLDIFENIRKNNNDKS